MYSQWQFSHIQSIQSCDSYRSGFKTSWIYFMMPHLYFSASIFSISSIRFVHRTTAAIRRHRDSFAPRLVGKRWNRHFRGRELSWISIQTCTVPSSSRLLFEINVGIDTSRLGLRLTSSPPRCIPRQMFLSIRRCILSRCMVRLFSSLRARFQWEFFCRCLACDGFTHLYVSLVFFCFNKKEVVHWSATCRE